MFHRVWFLSTIEKEELNMKKTLALFLALMLLSSVLCLTANAEIEKLADGATLTMWMPLSTKVSSFITDLNEVKAFQVLEEKTGVHIQFLHPPVGEEADQFNLMVASGDLPDMIYYQWQVLSGGPGKYIDDGVIIPLNDLIKANCPNYQALMEQYPDADKQSRMDDGTIYMFPFFKLEKQARANTGLIYRGDWADKLGIGIPETIEDWHDLLLAFKTKDPNGNGEADEIPFVTRSGSADLACFASAWGILADFYMTKDNTVAYGPVTQEYRQYLETMASWFAEGLIDPEFTISDNTQFNSKMTNNIGGAFYGLLSGNMGKLMNTMATVDPVYELRGANYVAQADGTIECPYREMSNCISNGNGVVVTTTSKNAELAAKWIDAVYSQEGTMLFNFGIEGESYEMIDGFPTYTDFVFKNPDGLTPDQAIGSYATTYGMAMNYDSRYFLQILSLPQQKAANELWATASTSLHVPTITPTIEESAEIANYLSQIKTYVDEMFIRFVNGTEPLDNFDAYVANIEAMNLARVLEVYQTAYDRYLSR